MKTLITAALLPQLWAPELVNVSSMPIKEPSSLLLQIGSHLGATHFAGEAFDSSSLGTLSHLQVGLQTSIPNIYVGSGVEYQSNPQHDLWKFYAFFEKSWSLGGSFEFAPQASMGVWVSPSSVYRDSRNKVTGSLSSLGRYRFKSTPFLIDLGPGVLSTGEVHWLTRAGLLF